MAVAFTGVVSAATITADIPTISVLYKTQDAVPGGTTNDHFASFGNPSFNDYNHVAFQATVQQVTQFPIVYAMAATPRGWNISAATIR